MAAPKGNLYALGNSGGRPPKFATADEFEQKITEYFDWIEESKDYPTICGLALYLGFADYHTLLEYKDKDEVYFSIVKRAKQVIMQHHERRLNSNTPAGSIFWLKNFGWKDTQEIDHLNNGNSFNSLTDAELVTRLGKLLEPGKKE